MLEIYHTGKRAYKCMSVRLELTSCLYHFKKNWLRENWYEEIIFKQNIHVCYVFEITKNNLIKFFMK